MTAMEVALTYAIADAHLKRLPDLDMQVVLVRPKDELFGYVRKRGRTIEKGQECRPPLDLLLELLRI